MAYDDLRSLLRALEREGDLKRIKAEVDPYLEVGEIVDRVNKAGGPALLFENVKGASMPLAMNVYGTDRRLLKALGLSLVRGDQRQDRRAAQARTAAGLRRHPRGLRQARLDGARAAEEGEAGGGPGAGGRPQGRRRGSRPAARAVHLARGRRLVLQPGPHPHQAPRDGRAQPRPLPPPAPRQAHHRHALADPQGQPQPLRRRRQARRAAAGRDRVRLPAGRHVRLDRAAAR